MLAAAVLLQHMLQGRAEQPQTWHLMSSWISCDMTPQTKHLEVVDVESADLLSHLPDLCDFIAEARAAGGAVYVHCAAGVSRSATVQRSPDPNRSTKP